MRPAAFCRIAIFASGLLSYAEGPTFDAASVKMADPDAKPPFTITGGPGTNDPDRFSAPKVGMYGLLQRAFDVEEDQISGPAWLRDGPSARLFYNLVATMPPDTTKEQFQKMLQNLLVERFHLVFHRETRNFPGYTLVVDKDGPKFEEVIPTSAGKPDEPRDPRARPIGKDGFPMVPGPITMNQGRPGGVEGWKYQERTIAELLSNLGILIRSSQGKGADASVPRVVDKTGLTGKYTFILEFYDPNERSLAGARLVRSGQARPAQAPSADSATGNAPPPAASEPGSAGPNIFVAIQKQLGLRLDRTPDVSVDFVVVDKVDKTPAVN